MGACCTNEVKDRLDLKEANLNIEKNAKDNKYINQNPETNIDQDFNSFKEMSTKLRTENELTNQLYESKGPYAYRELNNNSNLELREYQIVDNGAQYYGYWNADTDEREGCGVMIWEDGSRYDGSWRQNKANGAGRLIHADGDIYEGNWLDDKASGHGIYYHQDGAVYDGQWRDDKQDGHGAESWPDGSRYEGNYGDGKKEGKGRFCWADEIGRAHV